MSIKINKQILKICFVITVLLLIGILCWYVGNPLVKFASEPEKFRVWVNSNGVWGRLAYIGMMILQIIVVKELMKIEFPFIFNSLMIK